MSNVFHGFSMFLAPGPVCSRLFLFEGDLDLGIGFAIPFYVPANGSAEKGSYCLSRVMTIIHDSRFRVTALPPGGFGVASRCLPKGKTQGN